MKATRLFVAVMSALALGMSIWAIGGDDDLAWATYIIVWAIFQATGAVIDAIREGAR